MASKAKKARANNRANKRRKLGFRLPKKSNHQSRQKLKKAIKLKPNPILDEDPILFGSAADADGSGSESDSPSASSPPTRIQSLLEAYTKPQLVGFLLDAALSDPELCARIRSMVDSDISHRKIFVYGLGWDVTKENLFQAFSPFGPIEDCHVIVNKATGRTKGYGFVFFKTRSGAVKALKEPQKKIGSRMAACQLASIGSANAAKLDNTGRKVYVGNVQPDVRPERLREFFAKFGEIEVGPIGFDVVTRKSRGYALFVYKTQEAAKKALEEPFKMFEGHQLHCKMAASGVGEVQKAATLVPQVQTVAPATTTSVVPQDVVPQQSVLATVAAAQNLALLGQNPAYAALLAQNPLLAATSLNPAMVNAAAFGGVMGVPYGGGAQYGGGEQYGRGPQYGGGPQSVPGGYSMEQGIGVIGLQGLQGYQAGFSSQGGHQSSGKAGGAFSGYTSSYV